MSKFEVKKFYKSKTKEMSPGRIYQHTIDVTVFCAVIWSEEKNVSEQFFFDFDTGKAEVLAKHEEILPEFLQRVELSRESQIVFWSAWRDMQESEKKLMIRPMISRIIEILKLLNISYEVDLNSDLSPTISFELTSYYQAWNTDHCISEKSSFLEVKDVLQSLEIRLEKENETQSKIQKAKAAFDALPSDVKQYLKDMQDDSDFCSAMKHHISRMT